MFVIPLIFRDLVRSISFIPGEFYSKTLHNMERYRFLVLALLLMCGIMGMAQVPQQIPYRAMLQLNGNILANQTHDFRFTILDPGSAIAYQETQSLSTDQYGLLSASIGSGTIVSGSISGIDWQLGQHVLKIEIDDNGSWIDMGSSPLQSVPFAFHAQTVAEDSTNAYELTANGSEIILLENGMPKDTVGVTGTSFTAGTGISFSGGILSNTGDIDDSDDITNATAAAGDLTGTYPSPNVSGLQGSPVSTTAPMDGQVLKFNNGVWAPGQDDILFPPPLYINTLFPLQGDGSPVAPVTIGQNGASNGQVLKWDGLTWVSANDSTNEFALKLNGDVLSLIQLPDSGLVNSITLPGPQFAVGAGLSWSNNVLTNTGDTNAFDDITIGMPAGGDLGGTYPNPSVNALRGFPISSSPPQNGEILKYINGFWIPTQDNVIDGDSDDTNEIQQLTQLGNQLSLSNGGGTTTLFTAGIGISINGNIISNSGDVDASDDITSTTTAGGDLSGTYPNPTVDALQGRSVSTSAPASGEVLKWNGTEWEPGVDLVNTYLAGQGISLIGNIFTNTGDLDGTDDILIGSSAGGDLLGTYPNPTVEGIQGIQVSATNPLSGQVLKFNNGQWTPGVDADSYTPWTEAGNDLSYTAGQVGIGTSSPVSALSVGGNATVVNSSGNIRVEAGINGSDEGFLNVYDSNNQALVGMFINASGQGDIFAGTKNFRVDHPEERDKDIWYASLEGPEAGAYVRGTATLVKGKVTVELPDHFRLIAANEGMTVMLTPLSAESKGLAVTQKDVTQFEVRELLKGKGNYSFDWEVKAVRLGYENFEVIRPKMGQSQSSNKQ